MHVLVATDGSASSIAAVERASRLLQPADRVTLLHVVGEAPKAESTDSAPVWDHELAEAAAELDRAAARLTSTDLHKQIEVGDVGGTVCRVAEELKVDIIVVGSHGRGAIERVLLGSVTSQIVRHAPCAVLVVRPDPKP